MFFTTKNAWICERSIPDGKGIPDLYQEALLLTASRYPSILDRYAIDESVWKDFADFTQMMQQGMMGTAQANLANQQAMYQQQQQWQQQPCQQHSRS